jgi:hypothetical protein
MQGRVMQGRVAELVGLPQVDVAAAGRWLRERLVTTPGRIALASAVLIVGAVAFGVVGGTVERSRQSAAQSVASRTEPLLVQAVGLYASLSDADATATTTFLTGGIEPRARRRRYEADLRSASRRLAILARGVGDSETARAAVATISEQLPVYSGLVESARADNRQGLPLGAAYLRQASTLLREQILPAADHLYETEATRLNDSYRAGTGHGALVAFLLILAVLIVPLVLVQVYLARSTHRVFNVPLLAATAVLVGVWIWGTVALLHEQNALTRAERNGSDSVEVLSAIRILALRAQSDESLALIARGGGDANLADFAAVRKALTGGADPSGGLVGDAAELASRTGTVASFLDLRRTLATYLRAHTRTVALERDDFSRAIRYAIRTEAPAAYRLDAVLSDEIAGAQRRFVRAGATATRALRGLSFALPTAVVLCAGLSLLGLQRRMKEYR